MSPKIMDKRLKFCDNERVLCYQGPLIYEAKCLKGEMKYGDKVHYLIHYNGWNKHWDEWVTESRVLKYNESNLQKQKDLLKRLSKDKNKRSKISKPVKSEKDNLEKKKVPLIEPPPVPVEVQSDVVVEPKLKRARVESVEEESGNCLPCYTENFTIPKELQPMLVDDWDFITRQKQLFHLPAKITVDDILLKYVEDTIPGQQVSTKEMAFGLTEYFNVMLGSQLLYKFERPQYGDMLEKYSQRSVCQIYGAYHLLRFFVRMGGLLSNQDTGNQKNFKDILTFAHDCLHFMQQHKSTFFNASDYEIAPAEYHRRTIT